MLELEVEDLRKKDKDDNAYIKFKDGSSILDKILYSQRSPTDKSGLGFNNTIGEIKCSKKTLVGSMIWIFLPQEDKVKL